jgi:Tfp pilus assembly protein PilF
MTQNVCPKCGAPRETQHQFCPGCGFSYGRTESSQKPVSLSRPNHRREVILLALVVIATAVIFNVVSALVSKDKPVARQTSTSVPILQSIVEEGNHFMDAGQFDLAIPKYEQALAMDSLQPDIMVDLGACLHAIGENDKAELQFQRALVMNPKHPVALFNLGVVSLTAADTAAARIWWKKYLEVATDAGQIQMVREQLSKM